MASVLVFIPSYNDTIHLSTIIDEFSRLNKSFETTFLIINDGSTVSFPDFTYRQNVIVINLPFNTGLGTSLTLAMRIFIKNNFTYLLRIDSDGEHLASDLFNLLNFFTLNKSKLNVCFTRRTILKVNKIPFFEAFAKFLGRYYCTSLVKFLANSYDFTIYDVNSGMIVLDKYAASIFLEYRLHRYPEAQLFIISLINKLNINVFDISTSERISGRSTINFIRGINILVDLTFFIIQSKVKK